MGTWGDESCSNDACWDALYLAKDIHKITSRETDKCLKTFRERYLMTYSEDKETFIGICIWGLSHGNTIKKLYLKEAIGYAKDILKDRDYLGQWASPENRMKVINQEIQQLEATLAGKKTERHIPGLFERIEEVRNAFKPNKGEKK